ncbi:prenyltransferase [Enterococcus rivorum]|uniref:1,4-dihydroxy-2-naphthoate polyprenyltransferase n=1 Tax=Enterococcus rivorum TaxID=762845 RepID=A0A1E5KZ55_9ENTE|nr:prenyltransferase [Enterococcus rivorum]MBP2099449.1 1,4-dihydroxy-2-naphthoate octaprenyltransferase [Enterococcus rivorum]OEH83170.1 1,4-dihydroxy-2-naphthoate polyprenyltransferase [Enterococcus rivorum]
MDREVFFELVEVKAKTASVFPFFIGICFSWYHYRSLHLGFVLLFFVAMFVFNMAVDILDNYNDYLHAKEGHDYKEKTNIIGRENLSLPMLRRWIIWMVSLSALMGIGLSFIVGWPLLLMGIYCYSIGIFYSSGPKPLSSLPLGEVFSGLTMGFMIPLICIYINTYEIFQWSFVNVGSIFLVTLPNTCLIANLMLANNICDLEEDEKNHRFTLVHYLGKKVSILLFVGLIVIAFLSIFVAVWFQLTPVTMLLTLLVLPFIWKQTRLFLKKQVKTETFSCAIKILAVGALAQVLFFSIGIIFL